MDFVINPFSPGAGSPPPELVGREPILQRARIALARLQQGRSEKSFLLVGLRGVGKTVLLNEIHLLAQNTGYHSVFVEAHEGKSMAALLLPSLREVLFALDRKQEINRQVKRSFRILKSFINGFKVKVQEVELNLNLDVDPEQGVADSGDLEADLPVLLEAVAMAAKERETALALVIDEMQYLSEQELSALIMAIHRASQRQLPLVLVGAGLPQLVGLAGRSKSYAERLFDFPRIGALSEEDVLRALQEPVKKLQVQFTQGAVSDIMGQTQGYSYFVQEWGYQSWNLASNSPIDSATVERATQASLERLDQGFFRVRFDRLTPAEKRYLRALADFGSGAHRSGDIAEKLGLKSQSVAPTRNQLIKKGMIYSPSHGDTEFTVPLFDDFLKRLMP